MKRAVIIGGGAAGFFSAINIKEKNPKLDVIILEKAKDVLQKVKLSGGGRCNVTNACFEPLELIKSYPRGGKELLGPFHQFMTGDTFEWFEKRGVPLKIESDNRVFAEANTSQAIIDCFLNEINRLGIKMFTNQGVDKIQKKSGKWHLQTKFDKYEADYLVVATGSSKKIWKACELLGHSIVEPVPSLFTFNVKDERIKGLLGLSVPNVKVKLVETSLENSGPLLITHWGLSGPAILKLSAFGARILAEKNYKFEISINWIDKDFSSVYEELFALKNQNPSKKIGTKSVYEEIPRRLWERFLNTANIETTLNWGDLSKEKISKLATELTQGTYQVNRRTTFKEEFVTAGGIDLKEVNFKRFESKIHKNLFFAGEVLDIDAITGGFNFQNAWTGGYIVARSIAN